MALLKFEEFVTESLLNEELHLVVTDDKEDEDEDEYGTKYSFKKGDKLVINDIKDGEAKLKYKGKSLFIDNDEIKTFTKAA